MSESFHKGHRGRLKNRYINYGLDNFEDHNVLELLLTYAIPRRDVNGIAHRLIERFGSLAGVFDADVSELQQVSGIGENAAALIKLAIDINRRYMMSKSERRKNPVLMKTSDVGEFFIPYFHGQKVEKVYAACLDDNLRLIACSLMFEGGISSAAVSVRKIAETAIAYRATRVILAHNHPDGTTMPSVEDVQTTVNIAKGLKGVEIKLVDHIIVVDEEYLSMSELGFLANIH